MPYTFVEDLGDLLRSCQRQLCCPTRNLCHLCCSNLQSCCEFPYAEHRGSSQAPGGEAFQQRRTVAVSG